MRIALLLGLGALGLGALCAGCCCPPATYTEAAVAPARQFVVVRATPVEGTAGGEKRQVLIESSVITVEGAAPIAALESAERLETGGAPAWLAGPQVPDASFGPRADVLSKPSVLASEGDLATIETAESEPGGRPAIGVRSEFTVTLDGEGGVALALAYQQRTGGVLAREIRQVTLRGPLRRAFIVEALPAR